MKVDYPIWRIALLRFIMKLVRKSDLPESQSLFSYILFEGNRTNRNPEPKALYPAIAVNISWQKPKITSFSPTSL
jgi:hypothetical protein